MANEPPLPNDILVVRPEIKDQIERPFLASTAKTGITPRKEGDSYASVRPYDPNHYQRLEKQVTGLLAIPALAPRFTQWYGEGRYDFSIEDIKKFLLQDQEISGKPQLSLVLPGGGVKSAYQAEILDHLYRSGFLTNSRRAGQLMEPLLVENVVGTSGGAIVGVFAAQKHETGDERSLHKLWEPGPEVFPLFEILRWTSLFAVLMVFFFVFYIARIMGLLHLGRARERISPYRTPYWLSLLLLAVLFGGPILVLLVSYGADQTEIPWGEGLLHLITIFAVYIGMSCCVVDQDTQSSVTPKKKWLILSVSALLLAVVCLVVSFVARRPLAASSGLLLVVLAAILLAKARKLRLRLAGIGDCVRALCLLGLVIVISYGFFYLMSLRGWATSIELTKEFWLTLLLSALAASLTCFAVAEWGTRRLKGYIQRGILYFSTVHSLGRFRAERAQSLSLIFGVGLLWWSYVAAPAIYSGTKAYGSFYRNLEESSGARKRVDLQTNLIVTATALRDIKDVVKIGDELLPLAAGDIYFCFAGEQTHCPEKDKVQSKRWFEIVARSLPEVANPVFASGSPFPVFPPHLVTWKVPGIEKRAKALLVDGGYAHNVPLQAAALAGARQVLIIRSEPFKPLAERRSEIFPSQLARYGTLLLPFLFEQAQEIDRSVARGLVVASLSPYDMKDRKVPLLTDFDSATIRGMLNNADEDFKLKRRIGVMESWGLPVVFRQIHDDVPEDLFKPSGQ